MTPLVDAASPTRARWPSGWRPRVRRSRVLTDSPTIRRLHVVRLMRHHGAPPCPDRERLQQRRRQSRRHSLPCGRLIGQPKFLREATKRRRRPKRASQGGYLADRVRRRNRAGAGKRARSVAAAAFREQAAFRQHCSYTAGDVCGHHRSRCARPRSRRARGESRSGRQVPAGVPTHDVDRRRCPTAGRRCDRACARACRRDWGTSRRRVDHCRP